MLNKLTMNEDIKYTAAMINYITYRKVLSNVAKLV